MFFLNMKKTVLIIALAALLCACSKDKDPESKGFTKVANYLYEYEADDYGDMPPTVLPGLDRKIAFGCSSVRNGNFYGRNYDFTINETCEFVVRTKATAERPHASIGIANPAFIDITDEMALSGLSDDVLKFIPWMTMDGINDAGLICSSNMVNMIDLDEQHEHTNPGKPQIDDLYLVRTILDNCGNVTEALAFINEHDIVPPPVELFGSSDLHLMIADSNSTVVVEFLNGETKITNTNITTNLYNFKYENENVFFPHSCGIERYGILKANYESGNSMEGMWELLKSVRYSYTYDATMVPFWASEYYEHFPGTSTATPAEEILNNELTQYIINAYQIFSETGTYNPLDGMWFTTHNTTYDMNKRELWLTIRENYETRYTFKL